MFAEHSSTHVDSPAHFFEGALTIDQVPVKTYVGPGIVLDFTKKPAKYVITKQDLENEFREGEKKPQQGTIVLFYTGYSDKAASSEWMDHPSLSDDASHYLADLKVNAIGFDAPSPDHPPFPAHKVLLPNTIAIYENLTNLDKLLGRKFFFVGAPLRLTGGSASPTRALAIIF